MSEAVMGEVAGQGTSAGELLRRYREAAGLHVDTLAASLKVPVRKLQALEQDQHDQLTDAVFARALASSVCRTLKVDAQPVLERLPQTHPPRLLQDHEGLNAPFRAPGDGAAPGWTEQLTKPVFLVVYALLLGALVLVFLPRTHTDDAPAGKPGGTAPAPMTSAALPPTSTANETPAAVSPETVPMPQPSTPVGADEPIAAAAPAGTSAPSVAPATPTALVAAPAAASAPVPNGVVVFRTTGPSWIEVTDSRGTTTLRRLMAAGESAGASGTLPLAVTIGSVSATTVQVRGKPFDLVRFSRDNVARFEVK
ncbi:helix-turn-helix domain-containing protein [Ramlibacter sp. MMS24-I3-19]|uniref:helix-turn-helix domain-containing protein n=1 Tax=Ramlibacter sp. MMS24-I3-19 TaxID=3416606 RepID=UPI003D056713